jgi:hypothetical protein
MYHTFLCICKGLQDAQFVAEGIHRCGRNACPNPIFVKKWRKAFSFFKKKTCTTFALPQ